MNYRNLQQSSGEEAGCEPFFQLNIMRSSGAFTLFTLSLHKNSVHFLYLRKFLKSKKKLSKSPSCKSVVTYDNGKFFHVNNNNNSNKNNGYVTDTISTSLQLDSYGKMATYLYILI